MLEEGHAGVGDRRVVLIGDAPVIAQDLPFFGLDQAQEELSGWEPGNAPLLFLLLALARDFLRLEILHMLQHFEVILHRPMKGEIGWRRTVSVTHAKMGEFACRNYADRFP